MDSTASSEPRSTDPVAALVVDLARRARAAARRIGALPATEKAMLLDVMADGIASRAASILDVNARDVEAGHGAGLTGAMLDRLRLDDARVAAMATGLRDVAALPDPVGEELHRLVRPDGMIIRKVRVPLGVIAVIYEARPNVTADAAALAFKAGNACILRGGSEALATNGAILDALVAAGTPRGLPAGALQLLPTPDHAAVHRLLELEGQIDLVVPRGGERLIRAVTEHARVPVLKHYKGVCHVYVDAAADLGMAADIIENAKCQRPGVCNAAETLLVHEDVADAFLPAVAARLAAQGVELRGDDRTRALVPGAVPATEDDWSTEYLDLILAVRVVPDLEAAIAHIETYGTHHSDVIVTADADAAALFTRDVDSATVYVNASSRFTDGAEFGLGAEIGISTDKLHARGPCGVEALTTYKYVIEGAGHVRR